MVTEIRDRHDSEWVAIAEVARLLGVGTAETVRKWVRQPEIDTGSRSGVSAEESAELNLGGVDWDAGPLPDFLYRSEYRSFPEVRRAAEATRHYRQHASHRI